MDRSDLRGLLGLAILLLGPAGLAAQEKPAEKPRPQVQVLNGARVYHPATLVTGDKCEKSKAAVVRSRRVFEAIPEYQEIKKRDLDPNSAEYLLFLKKASDRFKDAVSRTVSRGGYDLIAEKGAVATGDRKPPDITDEVIKNL